MNPAKRHCGVIATKMICSNHPYLLYSHTKNVLAECDHLPQAFQEREKEIAACAEWGQESDVLIFHWARDQWKLVGNLYDQQPGLPKQSEVNPPAPASWGFD